MADDKTKTDARDRNRVAGGQDYEVAHLAQKHGISRDQARMLIDTYGNDQAKIDQAASKLKG